MSIMKNVLMVLSKLDAWKLKFDEKVTGIQSWVLEKPNPQILTGIIRLVCVCVCVIFVCLYFVFFMCVLWI